MRRMSAKSARTVLSIAHGETKLTPKQKIQAARNARKYLAHGWYPTATLLLLPIDWAEVGLCLQAIYNVGKRVWEKQRARKALRGLPVIAK